MSEIPSADALIRAWERRSWVQAVVLDDAGRVSATYTCSRCQWQLERELPSLAHMTMLPMGWGWVVGEPGTAVKPTCPACSERSA